VEHNSLNRTQVYQVEIIGHDQAERRKGGKGE
jgi:hypothetical protein